MHVPQGLGVCELTNTLVRLVLSACSHTPRVAVSRQSSALSRTLSTSLNVQRSQCIGGKVEGEGDPKGDLQYALQTYVSAEYLSLMRIDGGTGDS